MIDNEKTYLSEKLKPLKDVTPSKASACPEAILVDGDRMVADSFELSIATKLDTDNTDRFLLPIKAIDYINSLPSGTAVKIKGTDKTVTVESAVGKSRFSTVPSENFMLINPFSSGDENEFSLKAEAFSDSISKVLYACDSRNANELTKGVYLDGDGEYLNLVAMDGFRLAWSAIPYSGDLHAIIPEHAIRKLLSLKLSGNIKLFCGKDRVIFDNGAYVVSARRIIKDYINYMQFFKDPAPVNLYVNAKLFSETLGRAMVCTGAFKTPVSILREKNADVMTVKSVSPVADFAEDVPITEGDSSEVRFGGNAVYLIDALKQIGDRDATIDYTSPSSFLRIRSDDDYKAIIMPVRMKE